MDLIQTWFNDRYNCTLHFDTNVIDLDRDSRSRECEKAKACAPIISQSFQSIWMEFGILLRLVGVMIDEPHTRFISCVQYSRERTIYLYDFVCPFYRKFKYRFGWNSACCHNLLVPRKLMLNLFCTSNVQERGPCWRDFMKYTLNTVMCQDTCEPICFKLGMNQSTIKLHSLIPVWMTLMFSHRVTGKVKLVQSFCCKVAQSNSNVRYDWLCKEDDWRSPISMANMSCLSICFSCCFRTTNTFCLRLYLLPETKFGGHYAPTRALT